MSPQHLQQATAPPVSLRPQRTPVFGRLGPAERVGIEGNPDRLAAGAEVPLQSHRQIHVLADGGAIVAADGDDGVTPKQAERARDEHHAVRRRAREPEQQEGPHVLDDLKSRQPASRQGDRRDAAVLDRQPLLIAMLPPTATVDASSRNGMTARLNASGSSNVSASMLSTSVPDAALNPAFTASDLLPPFSLSTTMSAGSLVDRYMPRTAAVCQRLGERRRRGHELKRLAAARPACRRTTRR